jgi:quinohemoprotein amine dehydrogenase
MSLRKSLTLPLALLVVVCGVGALGAQMATPAVGIPINDATVIAKCSGCHTRAGDGTMARLSEIRTTPEVWEQAIKRMIRLNGLQITPDEARHVVRYLSDNNGLTLAEAKAGFWDAEHRNFRLAEEANGTPQELQRTCNYCHTIGRVLVQRRTQADYTKLMNTHMAMFPGSEASVFRPFRRYTNQEDLSVELSQAGTGYGVLHYTEPISAPAQTPKYPVDIAIEYLAKSQPLISPEWTAWHAQKHEANLAGTWLVRAYQSGKGRIYGEMTVLPPDKSGDWTTTTTLHYPGGQTVKTTGRGVLYAGYSWRGHSKAALDATASPTLPVDSREAMLLASDGNSMEGRWFWGGYQEFGLDVKLARLDKQMTVLGVDKYALRSPSVQTLHVYGGALPTSLTAADFSFGDGVSVSKIVHASSDDVELQVTVAAGVKPGLHTVQVKGVSAPETIAVYDKIDFIKVAPDASYARLGGIISVKQFAQFQAIGYSNGADGLPGTNDDVAIGPVKAAWSLAEFYATPDDDDIKYVGTIDESGLFTPNVEGPNPLRQKQSNNFATENWGDVWVNAVFKGPTGEPLQARSYLVVTVPTYMRYDQPEVTE